MSAVICSSYPLTFSQQECFHQLLEGRCLNPHALLGIHEGILRVWRPDADCIHVDIQGRTYELQKEHPAGLFSLALPSSTHPCDYKIYHNDGRKTRDPYAFPCSLGDWDTYLWNQGTHYEIHQVLGANPQTLHGVQGTRFAVWAPNARGVSLVGDFNHWDGRQYPMAHRGDSGVWELFVPDIGPGEKYKFQIRGRDGEVRTKIDPFAKQLQARPKNACIVADTKAFSWEDHEWIERRRHFGKKEQPTLIYEVHLGSWKRDEQGFINYRTLAHQLSEYCHYMGFTHVELLPVSEHPLDESWGYQVTGYYAPTSRHGSLEDFQYFVNHLHLQNIGVIIDWVPGHFPSDGDALALYDGTHLFEHADPKEGFHPHWNTHIFNLGRREVTNFLIGSALFWIEHLHVDALRVDAVASMLYRDYGREEGEWVPNCHGGRENLEAVEFLKHFNSIVHERNPGVWTIAEESTSFPKVTVPASQDGLGFDFKWNMGWMNDTLHYFSKDPIYRKHHHNDLTFGLLYAFSENFILTLSHDEVVHGKRSLLCKMPGDEWQKFAGLRLLYTYMGCQPGKSLYFMGGDVGQWTEWDSQKMMEWHLLDYPTHRGLNNCIRAMNHLVKETPAFWEKDHDPQGFEWVDFGDSENCIISYLRKGKTSQLLCVHNFTPQVHEDYFLKCPGVRRIREIFSSDAEEFGGSGVRNRENLIIYGSDVTPRGLNLRIAPLATMVFEVEFR